MVYGESFVRVVVGHRTWDNKFVFYVQGVRSIEEAERRVWEEFKRHRMGGLLPEEEWSIKEASLYGFDYNTYFILQ